MTDSACHVAVQVDAGQQSCALLCGGVCSAAACVCVWRCLLLSVVWVTAANIHNNSIAQSCFVKSFTHVALVCMWFKQAALHHVLVCQSESHFFDRLDLRYMSPEMH